MIHLKKIIFISIISVTLALIIANSENFSDYSKNTKIINDYFSVINKQDKIFLPGEQKYNIISTLDNLIGLSYFKKSQHFFPEENMKKAEIAFKASLNNCENCQSNNTISSSKYKDCKFTAPNSFDLFEATVYNNLAQINFGIAKGLLNQKPSTKKEKEIEDELNKSIENYKKVLSYDEIEKFPFEKIQCHLCISLAYLSIDNLRNKPQENKAQIKEHFDAARKIINETKPTDLITNFQLWSNAALYWTDFKINNCDDYYQLKKIYGTPYYVSLKK